MRRMIRQIPSRPWLAGLALLLLAGPAAAAPPLYVRAGMGFASTDDTTVRDLDCTATSPPALFGCGPGVDGRPLAARGDFGDSPLWEVGVGTDLGRRVRLELALVTHATLDLEAEANFLGVSGAQPVRAEGRSVAGLLVASVDLAPASWRLRPFVSVAGGAARNRTGRVTYAFPSLGRDAVTVVQGGAHTDFAWAVEMGASYPWTAATRLDLAVRHTDLGELRTEAGQATIVRSANTFDLDIAGTRADVESLGLVLSLRHRI